jgi:hypothetical protein
LSPILGPWVNQQERKAAVLETRIPHKYGGATPDAEPVLTAEIDDEPVLRNVVATIAAALRPRTMLVLPMLGATPLPAIVPLPTALL